MRKIFGAKKDEVTGHWRKLHNEELHDLYCSLNVIWAIKSRRLRWAIHVECMEERRGAYRIFMGKPGGKRPLGRPRRRWEYIKNESSRWRDVDWIYLAQDREK
jgi:hypothetical protein